MAQLFGLSHEITTFLRGEHTGAGGEFQQVIVLEDREQLYPAGFELGSKIRADQQAARGNGGGRCPMNGHGWGVCGGQGSQVYGGYGIADDGGVDRRG